MSPPDVSKQLKVRRRSRYGCRNCKLRRLKCDESKPSCKNCEAFGVCCNFNFSIPDLHPLLRGSKEMATHGNRIKSIEIPKSISNALYVSHGVDSFPLDSRDRELFYRFQHRTVFTLGGREVAHGYEDQILGDSFIHPFLMHGSLAVSAIHDRYLGNTPSLIDTQREAFHSMRCIKLFEESLTRPINESQKDAIWATAVILAVIAFAPANTSSAQDAWPLNATASSPMSWLQLKASDQALWRIADPMRPGSAFRAMSNTFSQGPQQVDTHSNTETFSDLTALCQLEDFFTAESDSYIPFLSGLSKLLAWEECEAPTGLAFAALKDVPRSFRARVEEKDPVPLLLLWLWYTRARECRWWIDFRAQYEIPSIDTYLQQQHQGIEDFGQKISSRTPISRFFPDWRSECDQIVGSGKPKTVSHESTTIRQQQTLHSPGKQQTFTNHLGD